MIVLINLSLDIAIECKFNFIDYLNNGINKSWYSMSFKKMKQQFRAYPLKIDEKYFLWIFGQF